MDQRPGQNVDLGLYFHGLGPLSPKNKAKKSIFGRKNLKISKKTFRAQPSLFRQSPQVHKGPLQDKGTLV